MGRSKLSKILAYFFVFMLFAGVTGFLLVFLANTLFDANIQYLSLVTLGVGASALILSVLIFGRGSR